MTSGEICARLVGTQVTTPAFGGSSTKYDHTASLNAICGGFGLAKGSYVPSPALVCSVLAVAASATPVGWRVRDKCDLVAAGQDLFNRDLLTAGKDFTCGKLVDFLAGAGGVVAAGASSPTGPAAVAVGVSTFRLLEVVGNTLCGIDMFSGAHQYGVSLETRHEHEIAVDVVRKVECIYHRQMFGQGFWSAGPC